MQLNAGQAAGAHGGVDLVERRVNKDSNLFEMTWQMRNDGRHLLDRNLARTWRKYKADCISPGLCGKQRILE